MYLAIRLFFLLKGLGQICDDVLEADDDRSVLTLQVKQLFNLFILFFQSTSQPLILLLKILNQILFDSKFFLKKPLIAFYRFDLLLISIALYVILQIDPFFLPPFLLGMVALLFVVFETVLIFVIVDECDLVEGLIKRISV